jgi:hypothetical protein
MKPVLRLTELHRAWDSEILSTRDHFFHQIVDAFTVDRRRSGYNASD